jgi:tRNA splicing ligase
MDDKQFDRLINFVMDIKKDQDEIKEIVIKNTVVLDEHIRRTELAESRLEIIEQELEPIRDHVKGVALVLKISAGLVATAGTLAGLVEVIRNLQSV